MKIDIIYKFISCNLLFNVLFNTSHTLFCLMHDINSGW